MAAGLPGFRHRKGIVRPPLIEEGFSSEIADGQKDGFRQGVRAGIMALRNARPEVRGVAKMGDACVGS